MRLSEYLDLLSWAQADLAREAKISTQSVSRALAQQRISRRVAFRIVGAISRATGRKLMLPEVEGLQIVPLKRRKGGSSRKAAAASKSEPAASPGEEPGRAIRKAREQPGG